MDSDPLPTPPAEVLRLLRQAAEVADRPEQQDLFQRLYEALTAPTMPTPRQVLAGFSGEGQLSTAGSLNVVPAKPTVLLTGGVVEATSGSFGSAEVAQTALAKATAYTLLIGAMGEAAYKVAEAIDMASQVVIRWLEFRGH